MRRRHAFAAVFCSVKNRVPILWVKTSSGLSAPSFMSGEFAAPWAATARASPRPTRGLAVIVGRGLGFTEQNHIAHFVGDDSRRHV